MAVIAMTREMGTLGKDVAAGLAERLGIEVIHHELVEHDIAERTGMRESLVHRFLEGEASLWERWSIDQRRLSHYTAQEILELAQKGNVLIRGWGAPYLLRDVPHVICVRICAPMAFREKVMMQRLGIAEPHAARREIERNDAAHNGTMQKLFGIDWTDASLYAITLNTGRMKPEQCADTIAALSRSQPFEETAASRAVLNDRLIESRIRAVLRDVYQTGAAAIGIEPRIEGGKVILTGAMSDEQMITEIVRRVRAVEGVKAVESRIQHLRFARSRI